MKRPDPASGMVVRYDYLWEAEHARGRREGAQIIDRTSEIVPQSGSEQSQAIVAALGKMGALG